jgi:chemotaxis regulatin CheY-phosphate phosphatase CheZ
MPAPRKVFRIEETAAARLPRRVEATPASSAPLRHDDGLQSKILAEFIALRAMLTAPVQLPGDANVQGDGEATHLTRIAQELNAVVTGTDEATQKILAAAEEIDQAANNLSAALKGKIEQGLAQDIRDQIIRIFEACNFQDLTGQRVGKVLSALKMIDDHVARVIEAMKNAPPPHQAAQYLHGPRLDGDSGHATQTEIDDMFG